MSNFIGAAEPAAEARSQIRRSMSVDQFFVLSTAPQAPSVHLERDGGLLGADVNGMKILFRTDGGAGGKVDGRPLPTRVAPNPK